jgi:hypothetical protein
VTAARIHDSPRSGTAAAAPRPVKRRLSSAFSCTRRTARPVPSTSEVVMARLAAMSVALKPAPSRFHTGTKNSLLGSTSGPHSSIENWPLSSNGLYTKK